MSEQQTTPQSAGRRQATYLPGDTGDDPNPDRMILGVTRKQRFRLYFWLAVVLVSAFLLWSLFYLRPDRWHTYTDQIAFNQVARDVT
ncbi:MAG TPA: hypothetical protein DIV39_07930, partial [Verrucomicrobiales bacterium]|nr:hypothetical protein [Verrucomicrobiales bacterium]